MLTKLSNCLLSIVQICFYLSICILQSLGCLYYLIIGDKVEAIRSLNERFIESSDGTYYKSVWDVFKKKKFKKIQTASFDVTIEDGELFIDEIIGYNDRRHDIDTKEIVKISKEGKLFYRRRCLDFTDEKLAMRLYSFVKQLVDDRTAALDALATHGLSLENRYIETPDS
jgi:hypothetical protein